MVETARRAVAAAGHRFTVTAVVHSHFAGHVWLVHQPVLALCRMALFGLVGVHH